MNSKRYLMSRTYRSVVVALGALCFLGSFLYSQSQAATPAQSKPSVPGVTHDPTRPETQQSLDVDRDPIPSPDPEENINASAPATKEQNGTLQKQRDGSYTMHAEVDEVLLSCTVIDEKGKSVTDLGRKSFRIWEDGVAEETSSFQHQDLPVSIGILVDNSGSMRDKRQAVKTAALNLIRESNSQDMEFVVNFSERAFLDQGFTSDSQAVDRGLSHFDSSGTTALYDAVAASADELSHHAKQPKQVLLIITDGADNASRLSLEQAIRRVQNLGGPVVYTIGLLYGTEKREALRARGALESLSEETGGIAYFPNSLEDVDEIASEVARDIRNQYTIGYRSSKAANLGGYRTVHVEAVEPGHKKLVVRTRRGYYAKPQQPTQTAQEAKP